MRVFRLARRLACRSITISPQGTCLRTYSELARTQIDTAAVRMSCTAVVSMPLSRRHGSHYGAPALYRAAHDPGGHPRSSVLMKPVFMPKHVRKRRSSLAVVGARQAGVQLGAVTLSTAVTAVCPRTGHSRASPAISYQPSTCAQEDVPAASDQPHTTTPESTIGLTPDRISDLFH